MDAERSVFRWASVFHQGRSRRAEAGRRLAVLLDQLLLQLLLRLPGTSATGCGGQLLLRLLLLLEVGPLLAVDVGDRNVVIVKGNIRVDVDDAG